MPRINYIFIDFENVHTKDLSRIENRCAQVHLVLGARQKTPPLNLQRQIKKHAEKVQLINSSLIGKNALDFVLACEVGRQAERDPNGYFHIISKDTGFDSLIKHLHANKIVSARRSSLAEVPALMTTEERFNLLITRLKDPTKSRPAKKKTLESTIQTLFDRSLSAEIVARTVALFEHKGILKVSKSGPVTYGDKQ